AAGAGADGDRHRLRHDGAVPGGADRVARADRDRPCRRTGTRGAAAMTLAPEHLIVAPILIPFLAGALMLLYDDRQRRAKLLIVLASVVALLAVAVELLVRSKGESIPGRADVGFYLLGDWAAPYGIVLVADR